MNFDVIERKRITRGMSITQLCDKAEIDRGTYYNIKKNPDSAKYSTVCKLVSAVGLDAVERMKVLQ